MDKEQSKNALIVLVISAFIISAIFNGVLGFWLGTLVGSNPDLYAWYKNNISGRLCRDEKEIIIKLDEMKRMNSADFPEL